MVLFAPDDASSQTINPTGRLRVFARIKNHSKEVWQEITDSGSPSLTASWLHDSTTNSLLQTDLANTPEPTDSDGKPYPDPVAGRDGDPQLRIQQAETGVPVFLLKFIGLIPAGPYPDTKAETVVVLDLRSGELHTPSSISCIVADYPSVPNRSEFISCTWSGERQDFFCQTDADSEKQWSFLLIAGKRLPSAAHRHSVPKKR